jgi:hypothetical protein
MAFMPRTTIAWLTVLGIALWFASQTVREHPTFAAAACLATLLFSTRFVSRG